MIEKQKSKRSFYVQKSFNVRTKKNYVNNVSCVCKNNLIFLIKINLIKK